MEQKTYAAQGKVALVISQSKYTDPKFPALPNSLNDGKKMRTFLEDHWGITNVYYCNDQSIQSIEKKFTEMKSLASHAGELKSTLFAVVYYSGHGTIRGRQTFGHTVDNEPIPIEWYVRQLALRQNTFVLGVFDCCRLDEVVMSPIQAPDAALNGQYKILFSALPNMPALAGLTNFSKSTENFFTHFEQISTDELIFPDCLNNYHWQLGEDTGSWKLKLVLVEKAAQIKQERSCGVSDEKAAQGKQKKSSGIWGFWASISGILNPLAKQILAEVVSRMGEPTNTEKLLNILEAVGETKFIQGLSGLGFHVEAGEAEDYIGTLTDAEAEDLFNTIADEQN